MDRTQKWIKKVFVAGGMGAGLLLACSACCLPLLAPLLAWLGIAGLALQGPIGVITAGALAATTVALLLVRRRRRQCGVSCSTQSACSPACGATRA